MSYGINVPEGTANTMKLTILGATGASGTALTGQALAAGHDVTAVVRDPARLAVPAHPRLRTVTADVMDPASIPAQGRPRRRPARGRPPRARPHPRHPGQRTQHHPGHAQTRRPPVPAG